ncbi:hypothetical protein ACFQH9_28635 [Pseudonocardia lutea]|uniref:Uncharacterized protein n=1 Tax=Pseudonocardia lutea TaxID=2172015 RepID=A0ABW1IF17_9PSEU
MTGLAIGPAAAGLAAASGDVLQRRPGWLAAALVAAGPDRPRRRRAGPLPALRDGEDG